ERVLVASENDCRRFHASPGVLEVAGEDVPQEMVGHREARPPTMIVIVEARASIDVEDAAARFLEPPPRLLANDVDPGKTQSEEQCGLARRVENLLAQLAVR